MKAILVFALCLIVVILPCSISARTPQRPTFKTSYLGFNPLTGQYNLQQNIVFQYPDPSKFGEGPHPLAIWTTGSFVSFRGAASTLIFQEMADRGFVSATVEYPNINTPESCTDYINRTIGIYDITRASSAVSVLCSIRGVNCGSGIVSSGISQGAAIAILAKNYAPAVAAVYAMSISDFNKVGGISLSSCLDDPVTAIPPDRLVIVNGERDMVFGGQTPLMNVAGLQCPEGTFQCWHPSFSGAGWYIVQDSQVLDHFADHCYPYIGSCIDPLGLDPNWAFRNYNWSLKSNLDWLASLGTRRSTEFK